jgi:hypothetical protein
MKASVRAVATAIVACCAVGCDVETSGIAFLLNVSADFVCPGDPVEVSWEIPKEEGCPASGIGAPRCSSLVALTPPGLFEPPPPLGIHGTEGSRTVEVTGDTTFGLSAQICFDDECRSDDLSTGVTVVDGTAPRVLTFAGGCEGAASTHDVVDLSRLSSCLSIRQVCTVAANGGPIRVTALDGPNAGLSMDLGLTAQCTNVFDGPGVRFSVTPLFTVDPRGDLCGSTETAGGPPDLHVQVGFDCGDPASCRPSEP